MKIQLLNRSVSLALRIADTRKPCEPAVRLPDKKPPFAASPVRSPFDRARPEEEQAVSGRMAEFLARLSGEKEIGAESVIVARNGRVVLEAAKEPASFDLWKNVFSESKTLTGLAVGFLFDEGKLRLDEKLIDIFPDKIQPLQKIGLAGLNLRHLLTMSSLADFNEFQSMASVEWVRDYFEDGLHGIPGSAFQYNSLNSFLLSAVVREKSGMGLFAYLERKLFKPLEIENVYWEKSPDGVEKGGWGLYIRPEDLLKIAELVRQNGVFRGKKLLSGRWVEAMCRPAIKPEEENGDFSYGLHIWVGNETGSRLFNGMFGQNAIVYPDTGFSVVLNASNADLFQQGPFFGLCDEYFAAKTLRAAEPGEGLPDLEETVKSFRDGDTARETPAQKSAKQLFFSFFRRKDKAKGAELPEGALPFLNRSYLPDRIDYSLGVMPRVMQAVENEYTPGLSRLSFGMQGSFTVTFTEGKHTHAIPVGIGEWKESRERFGGTEWILRTRGRFAFDEDGRPALVLDIRFVETPFRRVFRFYLDGDKMELRADEKPGKAFLLRFAETMSGSIREKPVVGTAIARIDPDLLGYKLDTVFSPRMILSEDLTSGKNEI
ncbi:MAG: serine hydrolase [Clostridia bacterium]|nr:serine hydrolase [Clostridia bacterium]